jgi:hypothetical protein
MLHVESCMQLSVDLLDSSPHGTHTGMPKPMPRRFSEVLSQTVDYVASVCRVHHNRFGEFTDEL